MMLSNISDSPKFCAECGTPIIELYPTVFSKCLCKLHCSIDIITSKQISQQHRAWAFLKSGAQALAGTTIFKHIPEPWLPYLACKGQLQDLRTAFELSNEIRIQSEGLLIPNFIEDKIITGFWQLNTGLYYSILDAGLAFSFTLLHAGLLTDYIFVFQSISHALKFILNIYKTHQKFPPIVAHPTLNILPNIPWLPNKKLIMVLNQFSPITLRHLHFLDAKAVPLQALKVEDFSLLNLRRLGTQAIEIKRYLPHFAAISNRTGVYCFNGKWYASPSGALAFNADLVITQRLIFKNKELYNGYLIIGSKKVSFYGITRHYAYKQLSKLSLDVGYNLFCTPTLRRKLVEIALSKSSPTIKKIKRFGPQKGKIILLPTLYISRENIEPMMISKFKKYGGRLAFPQQFPNLHKISPFQSDQIRFLSAFLFLLTIQFTKRNEIVNLFFEDKSNILYENLFELFSVSTYSSNSIEENCWPISFSEFPKQTLPLIPSEANILFGERIHLAFSLLHGSTLYAPPLEKFFPALSRKTINDILVFWLQNILHKEFSSISQVVREIDYFLKDIPQEIRRNAFKKIFLPRIQPNKLGLALLVGELVRLGYLNLNQFPRQGRHLIIEEKLLSDLLKHLEFSPITQKFDVPQFRILYDLILIARNKLLSLFKSFQSILESISHKSRTS